ncbi:metallo-beta-lactamase superfamily protein [Colletotrichum graminicola M1.001]|uniref:Metallo-beta-lactamase superfamily protein n=1 Tax=Colletotrichum graminicola (strain M1.001 / M2 / FGSC 10212) TaxID=645133 RepID=E3QXI3_COLGM|nr:metallo-beta-lactamase superfamily protein [Colletotrichum graminicola M1.001]EFQ35571.1 metallo-beta-lactamase superfamily protein [Colletotrichum graminicola M1.001]
MSATDSLNIPASTSTVHVSVIDTTLDGDLPTAPFMGPAIKGFERWHGVGYAFLVTHADAEGNERRVVFDLGLPKDWENDFSPPIIEAAKAMDMTMTAQKYVSEILAENGVDLGSIEALIWSHAHPDHIGRPSLFPPSASLIVGPGVKQAYFPGWPAVPDAPILAREFQGREVRELDFGAADLEIGGLGALDYFGDGSFYLLSAPGHAVGHVNALARTTADSYIYMAGDSFHHSSCCGRTPARGCPRTCACREGGGCAARGGRSTPSTPVAGNAAELKHYSRVLGPAGGDADGIAFNTIPETPDGATLLALDVREARETVEAVKRFDASPDVLVVAAHDGSLYGVMEYFPKGANEWKSKGWRESGRWLFLRDFEKPLEVAGVSA